MSGAHDERLIFLQSREIVHQQPELSPIGEHLPIATVRHQLMGKLQERGAGRRGGEGEGEREREGVGG